LANTRQPYTDLYVLFIPPAQQRAAKYIPRICTYIPTFLQPGQTSAGFSVEKNNIEAVLGQAQKHTQSHKYAHINIKVFSFFLGAQEAYAQICEKKVSNEFPLKRPNAKSGLYGRK